MSAWLDGASGLLCCCVAMCSRLCVVVCSDFEIIECNCELGWLRPVCVLITAQLEGGKCLHQTTKPGLEESTWGDISLDGSVLFKC